MGSILGEHKFQGTLQSSFCVILLTTNQQMDTDENLMSLVEVINS